MGNRLTGRQAGKAGESTLTLANLGNGNNAKSLVSGGKKGRGARVPHSVILPLQVDPADWLQQDTKTHCPVQKSQTLTSQPPSQRLCCLSILPFHSSKAKYLLFGNGLFALLLPGVGRA